MPVVTRNRKNGGETKAEVPAKKVKKATKTSKKTKKSEEVVKEKPEDKEKEVKEVPNEEKKVEEPEKVEETKDEAKEESKEETKEEEKVEDKEERTAEDDSEKEEKTFEIVEGGNCPDFTLPLNDGGELKLADFAEKTLVLYYYPKDSTPGCTTEANGFSASIEEFEKKNVTIIGVSGDNAKSHCNFIEKQGLKFKLATDEKFGFGSKLGITAKAKRQTFLIENGKFKKIWKKVTVKSHAKDVLAAL
jgi:peroxiredoxin Q/BCP